MGFFKKIAAKFKEGLAKSRENVMAKMGQLFQRGKIDEAFYEELEEILIMSDMGVPTTLELMDELREEVKQRKLTDAAQLAPLLAEKLIAMMSDREEETALRLKPDGLSVLLFVGVNGVGKTTTIGKLAYQLKEQGKKVILAAGDTFRAGAIEQLQTWGQRLGADVIHHQAGSDPAAVIFDAIAASRSRKADVLLCDTAGRLHNNVNLMQELSKIQRVIRREIPDAPHEVLLVLDATTGQNALNQAKLFRQAVDVSGIVLTKLDGTAKGGIVVAIRRELDIPVKFVGLGEKPEDLQPFDARAFVEGMFAPLYNKNGDVPQGSGQNK